VGKESGGDGQEIGGRDGEEERGRKGGREERGMVEKEST